MTLTNIASNKSFGGWHKRYQHPSEVLNCDMQFAIYLPPQAENQPVPVLYWLSGLTCTDENFMQKAGAQQMAAELGIAIVAPDTSPRGETVPDDEGYDLGQGAGFYLNATQAPWDQHYQMYDYIVNELPQLIESTFPVTQLRSIAGHSMGGHGALTIGLKNPDRYQAISAFSPICQPTRCPWGEKAFTAYLGETQAHWLEYDACALMEKTKGFLPLKVDFGAADDFLETQLRPNALKEVAHQINYPLEMNIHPGYDHSYYFIASLMGEHLRFHSQYLR